MRTLAVLVLFAVTTGCSTPGSRLDPSPAPRTLGAFDGRDGRPMTWEQILTAAGAADFVIVGEQHDDATGHAVQLALVEDALARWPGVAVSMEMLERDEQWVVDDYFDEIIAADALMTLTHSSGWGGPGGWLRYYQPIVDAARSADGVVVAANAPRRYVRLARTEGYDRLEALPAPRRTLVALPVADSHDEYGRRFGELMSSGGGGGHELSEEDLEAFMRSQLLWDATMAESMVSARRQGATKVIHLVGQFHCDFDGGLVNELRARAPDARILVISMQKVDARALRAEDAGRADVVVYTKATGSVFGAGSGRAK